MILANPATSARRSPTMNAHALPKDILAGDEFSPAQTASLLDLAGAVKADPAAHARSLAGKAVILLFEKPSLRTRVSFQVGVAKLGGSAVYMDHAAQRLGEREPVADYGRNLERWVEAIVTRTYTHHVVEDLARSTRVPVINGLSDMFHPCQALADFLTLREKFGTLKGLRFAFVGDGNNVCNSLLLVGAALGVDMMVVTPSGYEPFLGVVNRAAAIARTTGAKVMITDEVEALHERQAVYTDVWAGMGQESEAEARARVFAPYQVDARLMSLAAPDAVFMHCLPAQRGREVAADVIDAPRSIVYDQAENRMHAQNALLLALLNPAAAAAAVAGAPAPAVVA